MRKLMFLIALTMGMLAWQASPAIVVAQTKTKATTNAKNKTTTSKAPASKTATKKTASKPASKQKAAATKPSTQTKNDSRPAAKPRTLSRAEYERQQRDLARQIEATQRMINDNDKSVRSQRRDIQLRAEEIGKRRALIVSMQHEIEAIRAEEDSLERAIVQIGRSYRAKQDKYGAALRHLYKWRSGYDELLFVLSAHDLMEGVRRVRYLQQYSSWRKSEGTTLAAERQRAVETQTALRVTKADRQRLLSSIEDERAALQRQQNTQNQNIAALQRRGRELQRELQRDRQRQAEVQRQIQRLVDEERRNSLPPHRLAQARPKHRRLPQRLLPRP